MKAINTLTKITVLLLMLIITPSVFAEEDPIIVTKLAEEDPIIVTKLMEEDPIIVTK